MSKHYFPNSCAYMMRSEYNRQRPTLQALQNQHYRRTNGLSLSKKLKKLEKSEKNVFINAICKIINIILWMNNITRKFCSLSNMTACILILLLLVLRIVNSLISDFPVFTLFHTKAAWVVLIGILSPATVEPDTELRGEFLPDIPDLSSHKVSIGKILEIL